MKLDTTVLLKNIDGEDLETGIKEKPATLGHFLRSAAVGMLEGDSQLSVDKKLQLFDIAEECKKSEATLSADDVTLLTERVNKMYGVLVVAQIVRLIDPDRKKQKASKK